MPAFTPFTTYGRRYSLREWYDAVVLLPLALATLAAARRRGLLDGQSRERIMLAVTEVNRCPACSWAHARMALREGLSGEEIARLLRGDGTLVPPDDAAAVVFAQHYADSRARPDREACDAVVRAYGPQRARAVLAAAQVMQVGNIYGIPLSALHARSSGAPHRDSSLGHELGMLAAGALVMPVALLHGLVRWSVGTSHWTRS